jgi:hypothetical protein
VTIPIPGNPIPGVPDYSGSATPVPASTSSKNPNDIWGLGDVYDKPVFIGVGSAPAPVIYGGDGDIRPGQSLTTKASAKYGKTQDIMQQALALWSAQQSERKSNPKSLTGYEQLQQALYASGFYGQTSYDKIHVGQWTAQTQSALTDALASYEQARQSNYAGSFEEFIQGNSAQNGDGGINSSTGQAAQSQIQLADPTEIRAAAQQAAQAALGRGLSSKQLDKFVAQFQASQSATQSSKAGSVTGEDLSSDAMQFAQQSDPAGYQQNQRQAFTDALVNMFAPTQSQRPNMTPVPAA